MYIYHVEGGYIYSLKKKHTLCNNDDIRMYCLFESNKFRSSPSSIELVLNSLNYRQLL